MFRPIRMRLLLTSAPTSQQSHTAVIDTLGYDRVALGVHFSTVAETTPEITLKIGEGDTTSAFTDIPAFTGGAAITTAVGFVTPAPSTATTTPQTIQFDIDCRHRKRYLLLTVTPFTTKTVISAVALSAADQGPPAAATNEFLIARIAG